MASDPPTEALSIASSWLDTIDLAGEIDRGLSDSGDGPVDVVALGKAAGEMTDAAVAALGARVARRLVIADAEGAARYHDDDAVVVVGEHPVPGAGSLEAGRRLVSFLAGALDARLTLFLVSGGASSLCVAPAAPLGLDELGELWRAALAAGVDITTLNRLRAATSTISGGAVLRAVRTPRSRTLLMVDNVVSGAAWVASGLTYQFEPSATDVADLLERFAVPLGPLAQAVAAAAARRRALMAVPVATEHDNVVVADPELLLAEASARAEQLGYRVHSLGSAVHGDVEAVASDWAATLAELTRHPGRHCVLGVGEVTVRVRGTGLGGRCQEFAWIMAAELARLGRPATFVARSSDGRDYVEGVAGAWVDERTTQRIADAGLDWAVVKSSNDSHRGLAALDQLIDGAHTGWNLCDLYVAVLEGESSTPGSL